MKERCLNCSFLDKNSGHCSLEHNPPCGGEIETRDNSALLGGGFELRMVERLPEVMKKHINIKKDGK